MAVRLTWCEGAAIICQWQVNEKAIKNAISQAKSLLQPESQHLMEAIQSTWTT
jgi:hypothetical protein